MGFQWMAKVEWQSPVYKNTFWWLKRKQDKALTCRTFKNLLDFPDTCIKETFKHCVLCLRHFCRCCYMETVPQIDVRSFRGGGCACPGNLRFLQEWGLSVTPLPLFHLGIPSSMSYCCTPALNNGAVLSFICVASAGSRWEMTRDDNGNIHKA